MSQHQQLLTAFIEQHYGKAIDHKELKDKELKDQKWLEEDRRMIQGIAERSLDHDLVKRWMRGYGLFQGIQGEVRNKIAKAFCEFAENREPRAHDLSTDFRDVYRCLESVDPSRKWLSASSKLLWCLYPHEVVIYDSFVERVILVLQHLEPSLANVNFQKAPGHKEGPGAMETYYLSYAENVRKLFKTYQPQLEELRRQHNPSYEYDIRIFDKLLWILGSPKSK